MPAIDFEASLDRARRRIGPERAGARRPRSDRGSSRLDPRVLAYLAEALSGYERPAIADLIERLGTFCGREGLPAPCRASVYRAMETFPTRTCRVAELPPAVRRALYNLGGSSDVPGHQVAFYCFNYGDLAAVSFAAGLPWLALHQALRLPGWRERSRGLAEAVARARGL